MSKGKSQAVLGANAQAGIRDARAVLCNNTDHDFNDIGKLANLIPSGVAVLNTLEHMLKAQAAFRDMIRSRSRKILDWAKEALAESRREDALLALRLLEQHTPKSNAARDLRALLFPAPPNTTPDEGDEGTNPLPDNSNAVAVNEVVLSALPPDTVSNEAIIGAGPTEETIFAQEEIEGAGGTPADAMSAETIFALADESVLTEAPVQVVFSPLGKTMIIFDFPDTQLGRQVSGLRNFVLNGTSGSAQSRLQPNSIMNQLLAQATDPDTERLAGYVAVLEAAFLSLKPNTVVFDEAPAPAPDPAPPAAENIAVI